MPSHPILFELESDTGLQVAEAFAALVARYFADTRDPSARVSTPLSPAEIAKRFDEPLPAQGRPLADVVARLERDVLPDCNRLTHPRSMGHQVSAPLPVAVWTEALTGAMNQSAAVWEMSPVGTIIETQVVRWMCSLAGFGAEAGGTFTSGGTEATFAGLLAARRAALPDAWTNGVGAHPPVVVCGEHAHYGVSRAIGELGLGTNNAVIVPSRDFRIDVGALERQLERLAGEGRTVMAVVATAGTTATGSFDDLESIGRLCEQRGVWLHVDGAHGASALLSPAHRHRLAGIHRARSVAWDPHKMMLMPLTASVVLARDESDLEAAFSQRAPYLFHSRRPEACATGVERRRPEACATGVERRRPEACATEQDRTWDQGLRSFTCSRRVDALKVWVAIQRYGADGLAALYEHLCERAATLHAAIRERDDFEALHEPESNIVCFRWVGNGDIDPERLDGINQRAREEYNRAGTGWITTTVLGGRRVLRTTLMNPRTTERDLEATLDELSRVAGELAGT